MEYLILDFNGTVLDDRQASLDALNCAISKYLDRKPVEMDEYLHIFTFPISEYYKNAGFDFENGGYTYEQAGQVWFDYYTSHKESYKIHKEIFKLIDEARLKNYRVVLLSASQLTLLKEQLKELNIESYFDEVLGIDNIYAQSKMEIALGWSKGKDLSKSIFVGDSLHDLECGQAMGVKNIYLTCKGHQARDVLEKKWHSVIDEFSEVQL